jgi:hypothetical protein
MDLRSSQPLTEMSTGNLPGGKGGRCADNLNAIYEPTVWKMWEPRRLTTLWASTARYRDSFTFFLFRPFRSSAVRRWLPTAEARVRVWPVCGVCGGQSGTGAGFLRVLRFPLPIIPPISPLS